MKRREFLGSLGTAALGSGILSTSENLFGQTMKTKEGPLPRRPYGNTGEYLSVIGFGGIVVMGADQEHANQVVREAYESGVNYFDVAPSYGNGEAEEKLGPALEPFRKNCFLACKSGKRKKDEMLQEFYTSLKRLRTDHFDLYQLHGLTTKEDIEVAFGPGGAIEALDQLKKEGKIRFTGFSTHSIESGMLAFKYYDFNSVLFPVNFVTWYHGNFGDSLVRYAKSKGAAVLSLKTLARSPWPKDAERTYKKCWYKPIEDLEEARLAVRFTLSLPVTAAIPPGEEKFFRLALSIAPSFIPLSEAEQDKVKQKASEIEPIFTFPSNNFDLKGKA